LRQAKTFPLKSISWSKVATTRTAARASAISGDGADSRVLGKAGRTNFSIRRDSTAHHPNHPNFASVSIYEAEASNTFQREMLMLYGCK